MSTWKAFIFTMKIMGKRCWIYLVSIFVMSTSFAMFSVMSSLLMKNVVDAAQTGDTRQMFYTIAGSVFGGLISLLIYRKSAIIYNVEAKKAISVLTKRLFHHEVRLPYEYYEKNHSGDFMSKISYDSGKMSGIYGSRFRRTVSPILQVVVFLIPMLILGWQITLCLVCVNILMLMINGLMVKPIQKITKVLSATNIRMTESLSNLLQGMEQARMYTAGKQTVYDVIMENETYERQSTKRIIYTAVLESSNTGFDLLCSLTFLMVGIYFVQNGYTTLGALAAIYTLYGHFSIQFLQLGKYFPELIGSLVNAANIAELLAETEEPQNWYNEHENTQRESSIEAGMTAFENVDFCYSEEKPLLKNFNMRVEKEESVAITGASGCGKTTISKLLLGLYPIQAGDIKINGISCKDMTNRELRSLIAYVPQEPYLFNMSIIDNIRVGKPDASVDDVIKAAKSAHAHEFIISLENGYDSFVGERGNRLSGGQRQRIAIARAIIKEAPIMLLDEATSALDNESEQLVNEAMSSFNHEKTIIMIAHRPSTIALADREFKVI
ncbi:MAG: ABC transporter ATP-binding protein [Eubacteriales bacterium]|nr:ABC transporter ATP-binding protein [Eubacteriales bacterium]